MGNGDRCEERVAQPPGITKKTALYDYPETFRSLSGTYGGYGHYEQGFEKVSIEIGKYLTLTVLPEVFQQSLSITASTVERTSPCQRY